MGNPEKNDWVSFEPEASEFEASEASSFSAQRLEKFRRLSLAPGQFRMGTIVLLMTIAAVASVLPRFFGASPYWFFAFAALLTWGLGPLAVLVANALFPTFSKKQRVVSSGVLLFAMAVTWLPLVSVVSGKLNVEEALAAIGFLLISWAIQTGALWAIWRTVFVERKKRR